MIGQQRGTCMHTSDKWGDDMLLKSNAEVIDQQRRADQRSHNEGTCSLFDAGCCMAGLLNGLWQALNGLWHTCRWCIFNGRGFPF